MGIDGIGKPPGGGLPPGGPTDVGQAGKTGKSFSVDGAKGVEGAESVVGAQDESLARLSRGEITLDQYLDESVNSAVAPLQGQLNTEQLQFVKETLREQMVSDPVLVDLVKRATGETPNPG
ncbi:MAG TPA: hypothetical protein PKA88_35185 [Polyangiaceae bacterium]|nr:hypothetical protein [Polyangiaceae bacterium]HMR77206.1 hypothetical protein [Polyangiaceae bacterium]